MLIAFTNIDFLGIGGPCNNCNNCIQCFLDQIARINGDFASELELIKKIKEKNPDSSYFFYPAEFGTSTEYAGLMRQTSQKAMTNGKIKGISNLILGSGFTSVSFPLYSDSGEMNRFYGYTEREYEILKENIRTAASGGLEVEVFSIVTPLNYERLPALYDLADELGVKKISLLPLVPLGKAKELGDEFYLDQATLEKTLETTDSIKRDGGPYLSLGFGFGLSKSASERFSSGTESWVKTKTLCPAVNGEYAAVNISDGNLYWCFKAMNEPWGKIGTISKDGSLSINSNYLLSQDALIENLEGICGSCDIKENCLGGCRSQAIAFALKKNPDLPIEKAIYSGQPFCRYKGG